MNTKIFKKENSNLALGHQKVATYRTISKVMMATIAIAAVALLFASGYIVGSQQASATNACVYPIQKSPGGQLHLFYPNPHIIERQQLQRIGSGEGIGESKGTGICNG